MVVTKFESKDARKAWPCFDEPSLKATWKITIQHPKTFHALSNMHVEKKVCSFINACSCMYIYIC